MNLKTRFPRIHRAGLVGAVAATLLAMSAGAATAEVSPPVLEPAAGEFADVPDEHVFVDDVAWMAESDVTRGCNPPANNRYCPEEFVTRGQMAAFLHRLATSRVVDAGWLQGRGWGDPQGGGTEPGGDGGDDDPVTDDSQYLGVNDKAADSDKLDGKDSTEFLLVGDQAGDSDTLDGKDSGDFLGSSVTPRSDVMNLTAGNPNNHTVNCSSDEVAVSGGFEVSGVPAGTSIDVRGNHPDGNGWTVAAELSANGSITVHVQCLAIG